MDRRNEPWHHPDDQPYLSESKHDTQMPTMSPDIGDDVSGSDGRIHESAACTSPSKVVNVPSQQPHQGKHGNDTHLELPGVSGVETCLPGNHSNGKGARPKTKTRSNNNRKKKHSKGRKGDHQSCKVKTTQETNLSKTHLTNLNTNVDADTRSLPFAAESKLTLREEDGPAHPLPFLPLMSASHLRLDEAANSLDKNLVDEGAICDFDKLPGILCDDLSDLENQDQSKGDSVQDDRETPQDILSHNAIEAHISLHDATANLSLLSCDSQSNMSSGAYATPKRSFSTVASDSGHVVSSLQGHLSVGDDGEDTGDFIDTDLPARGARWPLLSSSDDMADMSSSDSDDRAHYDRAELPNCKHCNDMSPVEDPLVHRATDSPSSSVYVADVCILKNIHIPCPKSPLSNANNDRGDLICKHPREVPYNSRLNSACGTEATNTQSSPSGDFNDPPGVQAFRPDQEQSSDLDSHEEVSDDVDNSDRSDEVDRVILPMEEAIEPVHLGLGSLDDRSNAPLEPPSPGSSGVTHGRPRLPHPPGILAPFPSTLHPGSGLPSREFFELIKTVSSMETCVRFFDAEGQDVQRPEVTPKKDDEDNEGASPKVGEGATPKVKVDKVMIWNEYEAYVMQFKQIAVSACGQTAVLNVLRALKIPCDKAGVVKAIQTNLRAEEADIPTYLFSRACAGTTAQELMSGIDHLSEGKVGGRFFHFWPPRKVKLLQWLAYWMHRGAIPVATLNLQQGPHSLWQIPDSWHHQMVYGVSPQGLYLTNPLEIVSERTALQQVCSASVLKVRRQDVISHFKEDTDLRQLIGHQDERWRTMNVMGQVVNILREFNMPSVPGYRLQVTSHVSIPADYQAGITLFMAKDKPAWQSLQSAPDLEIQADV